MRLTENALRAALAADANVLVVDAVVVPPTRHVALPNPLLVAGTLHIIKPDLTRATTERLTIS